MPGMRRVKDTKAAADPFLDVAFKLSPFSEPLTTYIVTHAKFGTLEERKGLVEP